MANNTLNYSASPPEDQVFLSTMDSLTLYIDLFVTTNASVIMSADPAPDEYWSMDPTPKVHKSEQSHPQHLQPRLTNTRATTPQWPNTLTGTTVSFRAGVMSTGWANLANLTDKALSPVQTLQGI